MPILKKLQKCGVMKRKKKPGVLKNKPDLTLMVFTAVVALFLVLALSYASGPTESTATPISTCTYIDQPGNYVLQNDLTGSPIHVPYASTYYVCIFINSTKDVILDCNGQSISGKTLGTSTAAIWLDDVTNVTVKNCVLSGYERGVHTGLTYDSNLINNTAFNNQWDGFYIHSTLRTYLIDNKAYNNINYSGIRFDVSSTHNILIENKVHHNPKGFWMYGGADYNTFINNTAYSNTQGFFFEDSSYNNLTGNTAHSNTGNGFLVHSLSEDIQYGYNFTNNTAYNNSHDGFITFKLFDSVFEQNKAYNNSFMGFTIIENDNTTLTENTAFENRFFGFISDNSSNSTFIRNIAHTNKGGFVLDQSDNNNNFINNTAYYNVDGFLVVSSDNNDLINNDAYSNAYSGVYLENSNDNQLIDNEVYDNGDIIGTCPTCLVAGILLQGSSSNYLYENTASDNTDGILLNNSDNNLLYSNTAYDNNFSGILVIRSKSNILFGNVAYGNGLSYFPIPASFPGYAGIYLFRSTDNILTKNIAHHNLVNGFTIGETNNSVLTENLAYNNDYMGFDTSAGAGAVSNTYIRNTAHTNKWTGMAFFTNANYSTVSESVIYNNTLGGFWVDGTIDTYSMQGVFLNPAGTYINFTNLSFSDSVSMESYQVAWTSAPPTVPAKRTSFEQKFVIMGDVSGWDPPSEIDSITWFWLDSELTENDKNYDENYFELWKYNSSGWHMISSTLDTTANTITASNLQARGVYGIFEFNDFDGDGVPNNKDDCDFTPGDAEKNGCPYADLITLTLHTVDQQVKPTTNTIDPIDGVEVRVFNRNDADFQANWSKGLKADDYGIAFEDGTGMIGSCTTGFDGTCVFGETAMGDYLVIAKYMNGDAEVYAGGPKTFNVTTGWAEKDLQIIKHIKKDGTTTYKGAAKAIVEGSYLEILYPAYTVWEDTEEYYPFIFTSDSAWTTNVCLEVPKGYDIAGVYDDEGNFVPSTSCEQSFVDGETKVMVFSIIETGSPKPDVKAKFKLKDPKGKTKSLDVEIPGKWADKDKDKGKDKDK